MASVANLPEDGIPAKLLSVHEDNEDEAQSMHDTEDDLTNDTRSFLPFPMTETTEDKAIVQ